MIYDNILGTIGRTPIVRINRLAPAGTTMYVKCEFFNPLASVKDRLAIAIIEDAERSGTLKPGQTVVEATSGNTGIALAMVCAAKGYPVRRGDGGNLLDRAPQDHAHARRQGHPHARRRARPGHGAQGRRARAETRLVPRAPVREPGQPGLSPQHDRPGNPPGLRRQASRLLRHRLGHRRHAHRRRRSAQARAPGREDHRHRAGSGAVARRQDRSRRTRSRAGRRTSSRQCSTRALPIASCR